jgi:hypothetical protein
MIDKYKLAKQEEEEAISREEEILEGDSVSPAQGKVLSVLFERVGDSFRSAEKSLDAKKNYEKARKYTPYETTKERITHKIENISSSSELSWLEKKLTAFFAISFLLASLVFVSSSLTGNVIAGLNENNSRFVGICLFACGLIFAFFYSKCKTKNKKRKK